MERCRTKHLYHFRRKTAALVANDTISLEDARPMPIPSAAFRLIREAARHLLRRPVVGIAAAARTADGRWLLIRRGDTGEWALPGGTLEWGEKLRDSIVRELEEEAGVVACEVGRVVGVWSAPE